MKTKVYITITLMAFIAITAVFWIQSCRKPVGTIEFDSSIEYYYEGMVALDTNYIDNVELIGISDAKIFINGELNTITDNNGHFIIGPLPSGNFFLEIEKEKHVSIKKYIKIPYNNEFVFFTKKIYSGISINNNGGIYVINDLTIEIDKNAIEGNMNISVTPILNNYEIKKQFYSIIKYNALPNGTIFNKDITIKKYNTNSIIQEMQLYSDDTIKLNVFENIWGYWETDNKSKAYIWKDTIYLKTNHFSDFWLGYSGFSEDFEWIGGWFNYAGYPHTTSSNLGCAGKDQNIPWERNLKLSNYIYSNPSDLRGVPVMELNEFTTFHFSGIISSCNCCELVVNYYETKKKRYFKYRINYPSGESSSWKNGYATASFWTVLNTKTNCQENTSEECHDQGGGK